MTLQSARSIANAGSGGCGETYGPEDARVCFVDGIRALAFALALAGLRMSSA
jgi:hypothetical protein